VKKIPGFFILKENKPGFKRLLNRVVFLSVSIILATFNNAETAQKPDSREIILYLDEISQPFGTEITCKNGVGIVNMKDNDKE
jgi:hypothetical protein